MDVRFGDMERNFIMFRLFQANYLIMWQMKKRGYPNAMLKLVAQ